MDRSWTGTTALALRVMVVVLLCAALGCGRANEPETEVVVIATLHSITVSQQGYTPGHLRALLEKVSPDALAVEVPSNAPDPWRHAPLELRWVTKPWADERKIECVPADWYDPRYQDKLTTMCNELLAGESADAFKRSEQTILAATSRLGLTCDTVNGEAYYAIVRDYHARLHKLYGKDTPWEIRNAKIVENIVALCQKNRGKRVAVVFGSMHAYYIIDHLAETEHIRVIPVSAYLPLSKSEITAHTQPLD